MLLIWGLGLAALVCQRASVTAAPEPGGEVPDEIAQLAPWLGDKLEDPGASKAAPAARAQRRKVTQRATAALRAWLRDAPSPAAMAGPLPQAAHRCALGLLQASAGELASAQRNLAACEQAEVPAALRERAASSQAAVAAALRKSELAPFDISTEVAGSVALVEDAPDALFVTPHTVWLGDGAHRLRVAANARALRTADASIQERTLVASGGKRGAMYVPAPPPAPAGPGVGEVDLSEDNVLEAPATGPPPPEPHRSLLPRKYQRGINAAGPEPAAQPVRGVLTVQLAAGLASGDAQTSRLALHGRALLGARLALELGADWHHRFAGAAPDAMQGSRDGVGALVGVRWTLWSSLGASLLAAARGRLQPRSQGQGGAAMTGGALLQLELRPRPSWPLVVGAAAELERSWRAASAFVGVEVWRR